MAGERQQQSYSIQQLAEKAGVSVRTIRFYINEGLLAAPPVKGRYSVYNQEYLDRLEMIRRLKDSFLPLKEIRERVNALTWDEVKQALAQSEPQPGGKQSGGQQESALAYISQLLNTNKPTRQPPVVEREADLPESWQRHVLAPGIEIHIRTDAGPADRQLASQVIRYARKLFSTRSK
jgi:DNA-binding transcriptional MerR regulator